MELSAKQWLMQYIRKGIILGLALIASHFLLVLATGGYRVVLGPLRMSIHPLNDSLLVFLGLSIAALWLQGKKHGIPAGLRLRSPWLLFVGVVFIYSLNGRTRTAGDTIPASYLPLSLVREFDFDLDKFPFL